MLICPFLYNRLTPLTPPQCFEIHLVDGQPETRSYQFRFPSLTGRPVLVINMATHCSESEANFKDLQAIYDIAVENHGLQILMFPCNQFLFQARFFPSRLT